MLISGTRGAIAIPIVGLFTYFILIRNWKIIIVGGLLFAGAFGILKFTFIGQGFTRLTVCVLRLILTMHRLTCALENQKKLKEYLNHHILGGGIGRCRLLGAGVQPRNFLGQFGLR
jgi:hypothetical protein